MTRVAAFSKRWKRIIWAVLVLGVLALAVAAFVFRPLERGPAPSLDQLNASADQGAYLAEIGNCAACHTASAEEPFAGGTAFITDFGTLYSTNITPDREHGIGDWTFADFHRAMKHGIDADGEHLYPAFPYTSFAGMSDADIASLYFYLAQQPAIASANRPNQMDFPFGNRDLLYFWQRLFHDSEEDSADPDRPAQWNRGAYLVESVAHCGECHSPRNFLGGRDRSRAMQGGTYVDQVSNGNYRQWSAVDLTPGPHGLANWSAEDFEAYLAGGINGHAVVHGPMNEVFDATSRLTPDDRSAMASYLAQLEPSPARWNLSLPDFGISEGEIVYTVHCGTCHLPDGVGDPTLGVSLNSNPIVQAEDPSSLINVILYGPDIPPPPFAVDRTRMKPFGRRLSDQDIAAVASYLRSNFDNNAGSVTPEQVAMQR